LQNANATDDWHLLEAQAPAVTIPFLKVTMQRQASLFRGRGTAHPSPIELRA
jgi:hypothetical protein